MAGYDTEVTSVEVSLKCLETVTKCIKRVESSYGVKHAVEAKRQSVRACSFKWVARAPGSARGR